ncbi:MAG: hypothetical protein J4478_00145 [Candidatus Diapherotrites archaeon]|uniref:Pyridoxal phosphate-dependent aminotransferase n=1 Tax=Candidatus Iainarchaeum sp. TaxID=3101447 RepID=A0A8T4KRR4_9ARCH|nr:hypothetical protein [Candidatus Diapherotrites archaeon]
MPYSGLSKRIAELPKSQIAKIIKIAEEDKSIISLGPGEPDSLLSSLRKERTVGSDCKKTPQGKQNQG